MNDSLPSEQHQPLVQEHKSILLIDDDVKYCQLVSRYLSNHGYEVTLAHHGKGGLEIALAQSFDAVMLDIMLPGIGGFEILRSIREHSRMPVLMLTALSDETDRIVGLELGADDYLPKSYSPREILARLRAVLRRSQFNSLHPPPTRKYVAGPVTIDPDTRKVTLDGNPIRLTTVEFDLIVSLVQAKGRIKTREELLNEIRNVDYDSCDRSIDVHISLLRKKLNDDAKNPRLIKTIRSVGYSFVNPDENQP